VSTSLSTHREAGLDKSRDSGESVHRLSCQSSRFDEHSQSHPIHAYGAHRNTRQWRRKIGSGRRYLGACVPGAWWNSISKIDTRYVHLASLLPVAPFEDGEPLRPANCHSRSFRGPSTQSLLMEVSANVHLSYALAPSKEIEGQIHRKSTPCFRILLAGV
jgi:hypothetical protein